MRTMAGFVFFLAVMVACLHQVFAIDCLSVNFEDIKKCDDCTRCGGFWCNKPRNQGDPHCVDYRTDDWCPGKGNIEDLPRITDESIQGDAINPVYYATTAKVDKPSSRAKFNYNWTGSEKPNVLVTMINTTQTGNIEIVDETTTCKNGMCTTQLSIKPEMTFCLPDGGLYEYIMMKVHVANVSQDAIVKFHVPCACACSYNNVETFSPICNNKGDLSCGACNCHGERTGDYCEVEPKYDSGRGDLRCNNPYRDHVDCSGNGRCELGDRCVCFKDREGYQYFQEDFYCSDICLTVSSECESCLHDMPLGQCPDCTSLTVRKYNETLLADTDNYDRKMWVKCTELIDGCNYEYAAMRNDKKETFVMMINSCNGQSDAIAGGKVNIMLPTVLGIIAVIAAVTAVAGYMVWKARNPPMPLSSSQYQELDGPEGSTGINPLYKDPKSTYNNPLWSGAKV